MRFFILAQSTVTARALGTWLDLLGENPLKAEDGRITDDRCLLQDADGIGNPSLLFEKIAPRLCKELQELDREVIVLVDEIDWAHLDPTGSGWSAAVAMWILAFPEIAWRFGIHRGLPWLNHDELGSAHSLSALFGPTLEPLFDGSGLREHVKAITRMAGEKNLAPYIPKREYSAICIDDELTYCFFNAYTAYRFGFRAYAVRRYEHVRTLVGEGVTPPQDLFLTMEDIFLNFPDPIESGVHLSELGSEPHGRKGHLPGLEESNYRIFVSSCQTLSNRGKTHQENHAYIRSGAASIAWACEVQKPLSGMFDLWAKSGLARKLISSDKVSGKLYRGYAEGYCWPPPKHLMQGDELTGHGSPGRLLQIAELLIRRAEMIKAGGISSVRDAVTGAVIATDALELLGARTPSTATEALDLKHNLEVIAECQFSGVEYHVEIKSRLDEIRRECAVLASWFHPTQKQMAAWNAEMHIVNQIVRILREHNQFDEEAYCMHQVRSLHNRLWTQRKPPIIRTLLLATASYASWLMASFGNFLISLIVCVIGLASVHIWIETTNPTWDDLPAKGTLLRPFATGIQNVFSFFLGSNGLSEDSWGVSFVLSLAAFLGLIHLGIFLSFLYSIISRKS